MPTPTTTLLRKALRFAIMAGPLYVLLLCLWGDVMPGRFCKNLNYKTALLGFTAQRLDEAAHRHDMDLVFLGSSHAYRGFDVRLFEAQGLAAFNLGTSSQTPVQTLRLLRTHLPRLRPRHVVYAVSPDIFASDGVESSLDLLISQPSAPHWARLALSQRDVRLANVLLYTLYRQHIRGDTPPFFHESGPVADVYVPGGYVSVADAAPLPHQPTPIPPQDGPPRPVQQAAFAEILALLQQQGAKVWLVRTPVTAAYQGTAAARANFAAQMSQYADFTDYNGRLALHDMQHFYDGQHLNQAGVALFNAAFLSECRAKWGWRVPD